MPRRASKKTTQVAAPPSVFSASSLVDQGNVALSQCQPELASQFFQRALEMQPSDTNIMDALADVQLQMGNAEVALGLLQLSTQNAPDVNPCKWLYLAQLQEGTAALETYTNGISKLSALLPTVNSEMKQMLLKQVCKAYCSIAELYMTDLCDMDVAESECEKSVAQALAIDHTSIDALQASANLKLRLSGFDSTKMEEACDIMDGVLARIMKIREKVSSRTIAEEMTTEDSNDEGPSLEFCVATIQLLMNCSPARPAFLEKSMDLAMDLLQDDDENIELWCLLGVGCMKQSPPDVDAAVYNFEHAKEMMDALKKEFGPQNFPAPLERLYSMAEVHLEEIRSMFMECG